MIDLTLKFSSAEAMRKWFEVAAALELVPPHHTICEEDGTYTIKLRDDA